MQAPLSSKVLHRSEALTHFKSTLYSLGPQLTVGGTHSPLTSLYAVFLQVVHYPVNLLKLSQFFDTGRHCPKWKYSLGPHP